MTTRDRIDVIRAALDAYLHPPSRSLLPGIAALAGGLAWLARAWPIVALPAPPDWPGYLMESLPLAIAGVIVLAVASVGCWLRLGDRSGRLGMIAVALAFLGHVGWGIVLVGVLAGLLYGAPVAVASYVAVAGTVLLGVALLRAGDWPISALLVAAPVFLLVPATWGWVAHGMAWAAIGAVELSGVSAGGRPIGRPT